MQERAKDFLTIFSHGHLQIVQVSELNDMLDELICNTLSDKDFLESPTYFLECLELLTRSDGYRISPAASM